MILIAIVTLDDENPTTGPSGGRRLLLEVMMDGNSGELSWTVRTLKQAPVRTQLPSVTNVAVNQMQT
eukprot:1188664-Rhodomonas_salina.1